MNIKAPSGIMLTLFLMLMLSTVLVKPMVATYPFEEIFKKDLLDLANGTSKIESIYIKSWLDTRPSGRLWAFIRINYTAGLSDHEKISVQDYVQRQLESKWYIDIVERDYYCVIFIYPTPPVPWPGFVIGDLNVGFKSVTVAPVTHDIAVISVTPHPTEVGLGELVNVTVIVENQGTKNETFSVTTYCNNTVIETRNVTDLAPNKNIVLTFAWNTSDVTAGTYFIKATASAVPNETDTGDNTLQSDELVTVCACVFCPEYIALNATYHALLANYSNLLDNFNSLLADHNDLLNNYDTLMAYFNSLNSSYCELESSYAGLNTTYCNLFDMHSQLQSDFDELKSEQDILTGDLGTTRNLSYAFVVTTMVFIATTVYLAMRKPKVKSE